ncbi:hypothetical protein SODG_002393 [Sodalis praecaptivus]
MRLAAFAAYTRTAQADAVTLPGDDLLTSPGAIARGVRPRPLHDNIPLDRGAAAPCSPAYNGARTACP